MGKKKMSSPHKQGAGKMEIEIKIEIVSFNGYERAKVYGDRAKQKYFDKNKNKKSNDEVLKTLCQTLKEH